ncbi:MAG: S49 family peptidase [Luteolibacter sp.]
MKELPRISSVLYCTPWAILAADHVELSKLYQNYLKGTLGAMPEIAPKAVENGDWISSGIRYEADLASGIAILSLTGVIAKHAPDLLCGPKLVDLARVDQVVRDLTADDRIQTLVLNINSPGGSMIGLEETAARLREFAAEKRLVAYCDYQMCSAGYFLAAACDEIYCAPSAVIGSIGTYCAALDDSRAWEIDGLELKLFKVGNLKAMGHPGKKWTKEEEEFLQNTADAAGKEFRDWVTSRRPLVENSTMEGQWFFAKQAPRGLHDGLRDDLETLCAELLLAV